MSLNNFVALHNFLWPRGWPLYRLRSNLDWILGYATYLQEQLFFVKCSLWSIRLHFWSAGFLRRPQKFDKISQLIWRLLGIRIKLEILSIFCRLLRKPELYQSVCFFIGILTSSHLPSFFYRWPLPLELGLNVRPQIPYLKVIYHEIVPK